MRDTSRLTPGLVGRTDAFTGNVLESETLTPALRGVDTAYYIVHSPAAGEKKFERRDRQAALGFGRAVAGGLSNIIYLAWILHEIRHSAASPGRYLCCALHSGLDVATATTATLI